MQKRLFYWLFALALVFSLGACQSNNTDKQETPQKEETQSEEVASYTVVDDRGKEFTFESVPETIISLQPSNTEILFALGVGDQIVGATDFDTYPEAALEIERVSDSVTFNAERILDLDPDVVFAYTIGEKEAISSLEEAGIPVFVIASATSFDDVYGDIEQIAEVMNVKEKGKEIVEEIQSKIEKVEDTLSDLDEQKRMYFEISPAPELFTTGKNTFQQEIFNHAKVTNVFEDEEGWVQISEEDILNIQPDVIVTTVSHTDDPIGEIKSRAGWNELTAVQEDNILQLDNDLMSRPGPRIGEAVEELAKAVYPETFEQ